MSRLAAGCKCLAGWTWWLAIGLPLLLVPGAELQAQPRAEGPRTVKGVVREFTTAPKGEVDGLVLEDGTVVHWPPHLGGRIAEPIRRNDLVRVSGRLETGPAGDTKLEAESIANLSTNATIAADDFGKPRGPKPLSKGPAVRAGVETQTVRGTVYAFTSAPRGELDGLVLRDGTFLHWPPHLEGRYARVAARGDRVEATGRMETGPEGDTHLEVLTLTNLSSDAARDEEPGRGRRRARSRDDD